MMNLYLGGPRNAGYAERHPSYAPGKRLTERGQEELTREEELGPTKIHSMVLKPFSSTNGRKACVTRQEVPENA